MKFLRIMMLHSLIKVLLFLPSYFLGIIIYGFELGLGKR